MTTSKYCIQKLSSAEQVVQKVGKLDTGLDCKAGV